MITQNAMGKDSKEYQLQQVTNGRGALLMLLGFTVVNLVLLVMNSGSYFLFSASIPYYLTAFSMVMDGQTAGVETLVFGSSSAMALTITFGILAMYLLCWVFSKKRFGWLTFAAVLVIVDSVGLLFVAFVMLGNPVSCMLDILFHGYLCYLMIRGAKAAGRLKYMD